MGWLQSLKSTTCAWFAPICLVVACKEWSVDQRGSVTTMRVSSLSTMLLSSVIVTITHVHVQVHKCNQFSLARNETYNAAYVRHVEASRRVGTSCCGADGVP